MDNITKALQDLAKAVESNDTVERVKVTKMPAIGGQNAKSIKKTVQNNRNFKR